MEQLYMNGSAFSWQSRLTTLNMFELEGSVQEFYRATTVIGNRVCAVSNL
jgi:hypothetical protein